MLSQLIKLPPPPGKGQGGAEPSPGWWLQHPLPWGDLGALGWGVCVHDAGHGQDAAPGPSSRRRGTGTRGGYWLSHQVPLGSAPLLRLSLPQLRCKPPAFGSADLEGLLRCALGYGMHLHCRRVGFWGGNTAPEASPLRTQNGLGWESPFGPCAPTVPDPAQAAAEPRLSAPTSPRLGKRLQGGRIQSPPRGACARVREPSQPRDFFLPRESCVGLTPAGVRELLLQRENKA